MEIRTASALISFYMQLESDAAALFEAIAEEPGCRQYADQLHALAALSLKHKRSIARTYRHSISDAIEACFGIGGVDDSAYQIEREFPSDLSGKALLERAVQAQQTLIRFCTDIAAVSKDLLADISQAFDRIGKRKKAELDALLAVIEGEEEATNGQ